MIIIIGGEGRVVRKGGGRIKGEGDYRRVADTIGRYLLKRSLFTMNCTG